MKKVRVFIERGDDGSYGAYMPDNNDLPYGITSNGNTIKDAIDDFKIGYEDMKAIFKEKGLPFLEVDFVFGYDMASFLAYYSDKLTLAGLERITGIAQGQLSHYVTGHRKPSPKTVTKIQDALHTFGNDLQQVHFV